jgi:hypothetical protein
VQFMLSIMQAGDCRKVDHRTTVTPRQAHRASLLSEHFPQRRQRFPTVALLR